MGGAFHTPFMAPARDRLRKVLATATFHEPEIPVVANVDARRHTAAADWELLLSAQLCKPGALAAEHPAPRRPRAIPAPRPSSCSSSSGPGDSLSTMIRHTLPSVTTVAVSAPDDLDRLVDAVSGDSALHAYAVGHQGEQLYVSERVVISPGRRASSSRHPRPGPRRRHPDRGRHPARHGVGRRGPLAVRRPPEGALAHPGERVQTGQPIAWLHAS